MAYQISAYNYYVSPTRSQSFNTEVKFLYIFGVIMGGALVPLIVRPILTEKAISNPHSATLS